MNLRSQLRSEPEQRSGDVMDAAMAGVTRVILSDQVDRASSMSQRLCDCASGPRDHSAVDLLMKATTLSQRTEAVVLRMLDRVSERVDVVDCERKIVVADQVVGKAVEAGEALLRHLQL
jgi:hypothetical protein